MVRFGRCAAVLCALATAPMAMADDSQLELRRIGSSAAKAIPARDTATLLRFDRPDLRNDDIQRLEDHTSDLYCALFDSACVPGKRLPSVYEVLSRTKRLRIHSTVTTSRDGTRYGMLLFYDAEKILTSRLKSADFLCRHANREIVSWLFKSVGNRWESANPIFDTETDTLCSPD